MRDIRNALEAGLFSTFRENFLRTYQTTKEKP
jgi:queuine/archaeosine tRNA-ribosyltransferase